MLEKIIKVTKNNVEKLYNDLTGNLYYDCGIKYEIVDGFSLIEIKRAMRNGVDFIFKK